MAKLANLSLSLAFLLLFHGCTATRQSQRQQYQQGDECQIQRLNAQEPSDQVQAEAGVTEFWDSNDQQFQCAGVEVIRHNIQPQGLLLPSYTNAPLLAYIVQGRGIQGVMLPGCPETFESSQPQSREQGGEYQERQRRGERHEERQRRGEEGHRGEQEQFGEEGRRFRDRHQKVQQVQQGDILAIPAGAAHWLYNDGERELVAVVLLDNSNNANQLDNQNHRRFFLAGNPQGQQGQGRRHEQGQRGRGQQGQQGRRQQGQQGQQSSEEYSNGNNIFNGFDEKLIAEAFNVDRETVRKLQGQDDQRGHIVNVERGLQVIRPPRSRQEREREEEREEREERRQQRGQRGWGSDNGLEETICSVKLRENIDDPSKADFYNPEAGRCNNLNSFKFPILRLLRLSAERGVLYRNAIVSPHWTLNAHNIMYVTSGSVRMQIVNSQGRNVFDDEVREGQLVVIPQNFAVIKQAREQECRWVKFRTNDNAMIQTLAGRTSALRAMPLDVISNAYQINREEAQRLKFGREETVLFGPGSRSGRRAEA